VEIRRKPMISEHHKDTEMLGTDRMDSFWKYVVRTTGERSLSKFLWKGFILTLFSNFPTVAGSYLRGSVYRSLLHRMGSNCFIEKDVHIRIPQKISLGNRVCIGEGCYLNPQKGRIEIGDHVNISRRCILRGDIHIGEWVEISENVYLHGDGGLEIGKHAHITQGTQVITGNHIFKDPTRPIMTQGAVLGKVEIGEDVFLGSNSILLMGVKVGKGSVIGAGAVVTKDIPPYSIAVGVPAKVIGKRE